MMASRSSMDVQKVVVRAVSGRWRRVAVGLAVAVTAGLLVFDVMAHLSSEHQDHAAVEPPRERSRRAAESSSTSGNVQNSTPVPGGAVYTRWGRSACPPSAQIIYQGIIGSGLSAHTGGGGEYVCLTKDPEYISTGGSISFSAMYGVEYQANNLVGRTSGQNAVCSMCQSTRQHKIMIPGRYTCVDGWTREYHGYLMAAKVSDKSSRNFICVDLDSEADWASNAGTSGGTLWSVGGSCASLPCPKYISNRYLTCVVCTR